MNHMTATGLGIDGLEVNALAAPDQADILTPAALTFLAGLERTFGDRRRALLAERRHIQARLDQGWLPDFLPETEDVRTGDWTIAGIPEDLQDRRVEITGPPDRKMTINALNSGASVFMADFEDSLSPTWQNLIAGQINLRDAVNRTISFEDTAKGRRYALNANTAVLIVRPRGWHLEEHHVFIDGAPMSASLFDFGLYLFHNYDALRGRGTGPYFYLPKLESHLEARLWSDVFRHAEDTLGLSRGTIKATVLIETILAAFQMDEILHELREHIVGLNCGRWDYIFSIIKKFRNQRAFVLPDRAEVTMTSLALRAYSQLLIKTCHRRKAHAIGGMAAQIPIKHDAAQNDAAMAKVRADKEREVRDGHDGTWVAHPGLVSIAKPVFDAEMPQPNQIAKTRDDVEVTQADLLAVPEGSITEVGLRTNIRVGLQYVEAWLRGSGCVPLGNLMEDAATAEISRAQIWQWLKHGVALDDGRTITRDLIGDLLSAELDGLSTERGTDVMTTGRYGEAVELFLAAATGNDFPDFLTLPAYDRIVTPSV